MNSPNLVDSQTVTVTGVGRSPAEPDLLAVQLGVEVTEAEARAALAAVTELLDRVRTSLISAGVAEDRLQTGRVSLETNWEHWGERPQVAGYVARIGLGFTLLDPQALGEALASAARAGGDALRIHSTAWVVSDGAAARTAARALAFADARAKADEFVAHAGRRLGDVVTIVDGTDHDVGVRYEATALAASGRFAVDPGQVGIDAGVRVTWELV